jgi:hypothetical protein
MKYLRKENSVQEKEAYGKGRQDGITEEKLRVLGLIKKYIDNPELSIDDLISSITDA